MNLSWALEQTRIQVMLDPRPWEKHGALQKNRQNPSNILSKAGEVKERSGVVYSLRGWDIFFCQGNFHSIFLRPFSNYQIRFIDPRN